MLTWVPLAFSRWMDSTWMTHLRRYTWMTLPVLPLYVPRVTTTSSSLRTGMERAWYLARSSLLRGELIRVRRTLEGAAKCALRLLRRSEDLFENFILHELDTSRFRK